MKQIDSPHNTKLKHLIKLLSSAKARRKHNQVVLEGIHLLKSCLQNNILPDEIYVSPEKTQNTEINSILKNIPQNKIILVSTAALTKISTLCDSSDLISIISPPANQSPPIQGNCVVLDHIQDPGNLGTILRSAAAAGIKHILLSKNCADIWSPKVLRAGMGAHFILNCCEQVDLIKWLNTYQGKTLATALRQENCFSLYDMDLCTECAWIFGNEGSGVSPEILTQTDAAVRIPMTDNIESLNVAMAATVCLFEQMRQQKFGG